MGYIRHHAIIVTSWKPEHIADAHMKAQAIFKGVSRVGPLLPSNINGYVSFLVAPDGSKEGWSDSDNGDKARAEFVAWMREQDAYLSWVEVRYGDEAAAPGIVHHSDEDPEEEA